MRSACGLLTHPGPQGQRRSPLLRKVGAANLGNVISEKSCTIVINLKHTTKWQIYRMNFYKHITARERVKSHLKGIRDVPNHPLLPALNEAEKKNKTDDEFRMWIGGTKSGKDWTRYREDNELQPHPDLVKFAQDRWKDIQAEYFWASDDRPYYNIWPIVLDMKPDLSTLKMRDVILPFESLVLRHAVAKGDSQVRSVMLFSESNKKTRKLEKFTISLVKITEPEPRFYTFQVDDNLSVEEQLTEVANDSRSTTTTADDLLELREQTRLAIVASLLHQDKDCVSRVILEKDLAKYDVSDDDQTRHWLEERARKREGNGFDVGRQLSDSNGVVKPHYRNPHLALYWTGKGRQTPVLRLRRGAIIKSTLNEVPTGFLGRENAEDSNDTKTWIYFLRSGNSNSVKIGRSNDVSRRQRVLQTGNPEKLILMGRQRADADVEKSLQYRFRNDHIRGEFYALSPELKKYIKRYAQD